MERAGTQSETSEPAGIRLAEVVGAWSLATDLGTGQPMQHAVRACRLAVRLGEALGLSQATLRDVFYVSLLQRIGCTADAFELAAWFDDEIDAHARTYILDFGRPLQVIGDVIRRAGAGRPPMRRLRTVAVALATGSKTVPSFFRASCEVAPRLAERLGFGVDVQQAVGQVFERWDGRGWPAGLAGETIALSTRLARFSADVEVFHRLGGTEAALVVATERAGRIYDPAVADRFRRDGADLFGELGVDSPWEAMLACEPESRSILTETQLDAALEAMAHFIDLKSPYFAGHSTGVAALATRAGALLGLPIADTTALRRAGLVHDLGRAGVPNGIWDKPGPLSDEEWERVRLHPYLTERVLARPPRLAQLGALASLHHERLDGSGYHRGTVGPSLPKTARVLAGADVCHALSEPRPHRQAYAADAAATILRQLAGAGKLDGTVVEALVAGGDRAARPRRAWPAGLSDREIEVLRLVAHGLSAPQIAERLAISPHTARHHVRHIYDKIGTSSRAAATLFAMQHDLLKPAVSPVS